MPVPSAVSLLYLSVEVMSTRPGLTFFCTAVQLATEEDEPLPDALLCGAGTSLEEMPGAAAVLWLLSSATVSPAPTLAASTATGTKTTKRPPCPRRGGGGPGTPHPGAPKPPSSP